MNLPNKDDFALLSAQIEQAKLLADSSTIASILSPDTVFATIAFCSEVTGPVKEKMHLSPSGNFTGWSWEGIDESSILIGYLSHNGASLRFQTKDKIVFDLPISGATIEAHGLGILVNVGQTSYVIGNFMEVNDQMSPAKKMNFNFGSESTIWMRELGDIGAIDKQAWDKSRSKSKRFVIVWFAMVIVVSVLVIVAFS